MVPTLVPTFLIVTIHSTRINLTCFELLQFVFNSQLAIHLATFQGHGSADASLEARLLGGWVLAIAMKPSLPECHATSLYDMQLQNPISLFLKVKQSQV